MKMFFLIFVSILAITSSKGNAEECKTPNNETAQCISLYSCTVLIKAASDPSVRDFIRKSICGGTLAEPMACCGSHSNFTTESIEKVNDHQEHTSLKRLLPNRRICGLQHSDDYFRPQNDTAISAYPWIAKLLYSSDYYECSGTLINPKYVLTLAICVQPHWNLKGVRLGEYHLTNETDCTREREINECSDSVLDLGIEKIIPHPKFDETAKPPNPTINDIGLIRLNKSVHYSDYIRPICLPLSGTKRPKHNDTLVLAGWHILIGEETEDIVKRQMQGNLITNDQCEKEFVEYLGQKSIEGLQDSHVCSSITAANATLCPGNEGSPLMSFNKFQWTLEGIALIERSRERVLCRWIFEPEIFTRVEYYLDWIEESLEP